MRRAWHVAVAVVATGVGTGALSACGVVDDLRTSGFAKESGAEIVTAASAAMADVTSMRVTGQMRVDGDQVLVDVTLDEDTCTGTVRFSKSRVSLIRIGDHAWFRGDGASYARMSGSPLPSGAPASSGAMWVRADGLADDELCDLASHLASFSLDPPSKGKNGGREWTDLGDLSVGDEVDLDGGRAVPVTSTPQDTAWISSDEPHHVVRLESTVPRDGGNLSYTEFDQDVVVQEPKGKDVLRP
jgi:hypothetical protein